jgi:hypothetical protein
MQHAPGRPLRFFLKDKRLYITGTFIKKPVKKITLCHGKIKGTMRADPYGRFADDELTTLVVIILQRQKIADVIF